MDDDKATCLQTVFPDAAKPRAGAAEVLGDSHTNTEQNVRSYFPLPIADLF